MMLNPFGDQVELAPDNLLSDMTRVHCELQLCRTPTFSMHTYKCTSPWQCCEYQHACSIHSMGFCHIRYMFNYKAVLHIDAFQLTTTYRYTQRGRWDLSIMVCKLMMQQCKCSKNCGKMWKDSGGTGCLLQQPCDELPTRGCPHVDSARLHKGHKILAMMWVHAEIVCLKIDNQQMPLRGE